MDGRPRFILGIEVCSTYPSGGILPRSRGLRLLSKGCNGTKCPAIAAVPPFILRALRTTAAMTAALPSRQVRRNPAYQR